jgi:hypothetical protein
MKTPVMMLLLLAHLGVRAQWDVPVRIELEGNDAGDRQVLGLAPPLSSDAAVSVDAARSLTTTYAVATGSEVLTVQLTPSLTTYTTGMLITIIPQDTVSAGVQLNVDGLGPRLIRKAGGLTLSSGDLAQGAPVRLVFDGQDFLVITAVPLPCPAGYHIGSREYCIEDSSRAAQTFFAANVICRDQSARLCTYSEWISTCRRDPGFLPTVTGFEWVDSAANSANDAKHVGDGEDGAGGPWGISCEHGGTTLPTTLTRFRCCKNR